MTFYHIPYSCYFGLALNFFLVSIIVSLCCKSYQLLLNMHNFVNGKIKMYSMLLMGGKSTLCKQDELWANAHLWYPRSLANRKCVEKSTVGKQEVGIWWVQKRFPWYGVPIWSLWPNIRSLPSIDAEKNVTKNVHICSMCIETN